LQNRRLQFRVILKVLSFLGLVILIGVFLNSLFIKEGKEILRNEAELNVSIDVDGMYPGQIKKTRWQQKEVAVLYRRYPEKIQNNMLSLEKIKIHESLNPTTRSKQLAYFVFVNTGDSKNCPLHYREGIFKDICSTNTFDETGRAIINASINSSIEIPPHYFDGNSIYFGTWSYRVR